MKTLAERLEELPVFGVCSEDFDRARRLAVEAAEKADLYDFVCALVSSESLQMWYEFCELGGESPETPERADANMRKTFERAKADGVYPIKTKV